MGKLSKDSPIIIKKKKHKGGHGHHGGAWKIAYADFVTAMMAFFLLMWLVNSMAEESKKSSEEYDPLSVSVTESSGGPLLSGPTIKDIHESPDVTPLESSKNPPASGDEKKQQNYRSSGEEKKALETTAAKIRQDIQENPEFKDLAKNLLVEVTSEGLSIQMVDNKNKPMFPVGSSTLSPDAQKLLDVVIQNIKNLPQSISIAGHTDNVRYGNVRGYTNWELSSDRATSTRRYLMRGVQYKRIVGIAGKAETDPLVKTNPSAPINRRVSILLKNTQEPRQTGQR